MTGDMALGHLRPYFLWDEDISSEELRRALHSDDPWLRDRLLAKVLREARDIDVWHFVTPDDVAVALPRIARRLGRRRRF